MEESEKVIVGLIEHFDLDSETITAILKYLAGLIKKDNSNERVFKNLDSLETKLVNVLGQNSIKLAHLECIRGKAYYKSNSLDLAKDHYLKSLKILGKSPEKDYDLNLSIL